MPGLQTLAVLTDLPTCVEQDEFRNKTGLHADGSNSRSGRLLELPFSGSAFTFPLAVPLLRWLLPVRDLLLWAKHLFVGHDEALRFTLPAGPIVEPDSSGSAHALVIVSSDIPIGVWNGR
jgi:hypothetical protein